MRRLLLRSFAALVVVTLPRLAPAMAQDAGPPRVVGVLRVNPADKVEPFATSFRDALARLGFVDGRTIRIDTRLADGEVERLPALAAALVRDRPSVIVALGEAATRAAQRATSTIPIVVMADDVLGAGLVRSLASPGGNTTGLSFLATELDTKKLEVLKEILPGARRLGVLNDPGVTAPSRLAALADTARNLAIELRIVDVRGADDMPTAFAAFRDAGTEAIAVLSSTRLFGSRQEIARLAVAHRLPTVCQFREMAEAGCLASYGAKLAEAYVTVAGITAKVLNGAPPGTTPVEQPTRFELVVNTRTARALHLALPPALLSRADEVIE